MVWVGVGDRLGVLVLVRVTVGLSVLVIVGVTVELAASVMVAVGVVVLSFTVMFPSTHVAGISTAALVPKMVFDRVMGEEPTANP